MNGWKAGKYTGLRWRNCRRGTGSYMRIFFHGNYGVSYGNPAYAVEMLGEGAGQLLSFLYAELRAMIAPAFEKDCELAGHSDGTFFGNVRRFWMCPGRWEGDAGI